jgi:hypothetical protein
MLQYLEIFRQGSLVRRQPREAESKTTSAFLTFADRTMNLIDILNDANKLHLNHPCYHRSWPACFRDMDGLSLAASVIAVIQLAGSCLKLSRKFLGPSEFGSSDRTSMTTALYGFNGAVKSFQTYLDIYEDDEARLSSLEYLKPAFKQCGEALHIIKGFVETSGFIGKHVIGPRFDRKLKTSLKALDGAKELFMLALHADQQ